HNTGTIDGAVKLLDIQPAGTAFSLGSVSLPATIKAGDSLAIDIMFTPHTVGKLSAMLVLTPSGSGTPASFQITGEGTFSGEGVAMDGSQYGWSLEVSPNPARDFVDVTLDVARTTVAEMKIYDATGREVRSLPLGTIAIGERETHL